MIIITRMKAYRLAIIFLLLAGVLAACKESGEPTPQPTGTALPGGAKLLYLWPSDAAADLYLLDPANGAVLRLTEGADVLEFSLAGRVLYFSAANAQGGSDLFRMHLDGDLVPQRVLACQRAACRSPQVSPDGQWLAYEYLQDDADGTLEPVHVMLTRMDSANAQVMGDERHETLDPSWSPDGRLAYYDVDAQTFVIYDPQAGTSLRLPNTTGDLGAWTPDGSAFVTSEIFYVQASDQIEIGPSRLLRYDALTGASQDLSRSDQAQDVGPAVSPDGETIAFARKFLDLERWTHGRQIWLMGVDGSQPRPLTDEPLYNHYALAWSPDGQWLAYARFNQEVGNEPPELWMVQVDDQNPLRLVIGGYAPLWVP